MIYLEKRIENKYYLIKVNDKQSLLNKINNVVEELGFIDGETPKKYTPIYMCTLWLNQHSYFKYARISCNDFKKMSKDEKCLGIRRWD